jgi:hypothetical protein
MATDRDAIEELRKVSQIDAVHRVTHFLYLPTKTAAEEVAALLQTQFEEVGESWQTIDWSWSVHVVSHIVPTEKCIGELRELLSRVAGDNGGEYDGWEAEVLPPQPTQGTLHDTSHS